jgi:predicted O-methyltransferase YrrM
MIADDIKRIAKADYWNEGIADVMREVEGMSAMRPLATLQAAVASKDDCRYLEIGTYKGLSARAAMKGNEGKHFTIVDSFEQEERYGPYREECARNLDAGNAADTNLVIADGIEYMRQYAGPRYDVVYYDGDHSYAHTLAAMSLMRYVSKPDAIFFMDDTNYSQVRSAMLTGCNDFDYRLIADFWTPQGAHSTWWNGWAIMERIL